MIKKVGREITYTKRIVDYLRQKDDFADTAELMEVCKCTEAQVRVSIGWLCSVGVLEKVEKFVFACPSEGDKRVRQITERIHEEKRKPRKAKILKEFPKP